MTLTQEREKRLPEIARHIDRILSEVLKALSARLQEDLVSVVLFGSHARGNPRQHSGVDLVIVVKNLPSGWRERGALELSIERLGLTLGKAIQVISVEPEEVRYSVDNIAPLMLEIYDAHDTFTCTTWITHLCGNDHPGRSGRPPIPIMAMWGLVTERQPSISRPR